MKKLKLLRIIILVVVVLVVGAVVAVHLFAGRALKAGIETAGTRKLEVGVQVADVDLSLLAGRVGLSNLQIDNPPGYQHERLLELRSGRVEADIGSLLTDTVNIRDIKLDGVVVTLEQRGVTSNNLQDVIAKIRSKHKPDSEPSGKKLHIDNLEISNVEVKLKALPVPGKMDTVTLKLKPIKMTDLGGDKKLDTGALAVKVLVAIAGGIAQQGVDILPEEVIGQMTSELKKLGDLSEALLGKGGEILKEGTDLGKTVTDGLKGLLQPKEKENNQSGQ